MKFAHLLEQRKVLNKESLDFVWELLVVVALAAMLLLILSFGVQASWGAEGFMYANF